MPGRKWTEEEINRYIELYKENVPFSEISLELNRSLSALTSKSIQLGLPQLYPRKNNTTAYKDYHDYEWNYERYIIKGMSHQEMADEAGVKLRTIEKWCGDIYGLHNRSFRKLVRLTDIQKQIIISGSLGDGHICVSTKEPIYIEGHAEDEKEYLLWKYNILKNICNKPPKYSDPKIKIFNGKEYLSQASYRLSTRVVDELYELHDMSRIEKINYLNELGYSTHMLDDGSRSKCNWEVCLAEWSSEEKNLYLQILSEKYDIHGRILKDDRYVSFDKTSSCKIDAMMLNNIDNSIDIIKKKIFNKIDYSLKVG